MSPNLTENYPSHIPDELAGTRADAALAVLFPQFSRAKLTHWLKTGVITIENTVLKPKTKLLGGESIQIHDTLDTSATTSLHITPEPIALNIVFEDDSVLVIHKPAGLVVHPGAGNSDGTLVNALLHHEQTLSQLPRAGIIHRLDKDTTGLLVIAKTLEAHTSLTRQMQARLIERQYIALVQGHVIAGNTIQTGFGRDPKNRLKMAVLNGGKEAITQYSVNTHYQNTGLTLLDIKLLTGRTHQIRVHMKHIQHPIIGDALYGGRPRLPKALSDETRELFLNFKRQALHARKLAFEHPITLETLTFEADLPDDFKALLTALDEHEQSLLSFRKRS